MYIYTNTNVRLLSMNTADISYVTFGCMLFKYYQVLCQFCHLRGRELNINLDSLNFKIIDSH